jgi:hypothetical protein
MEVSYIPIPVDDRETEKLLRQILVELQEQTKFLQQLAANVQSLWNQADDTPTGFKINESKP